MHYFEDLWSKITLLPRIFLTKLALGFLNCIPSFVQRMSFFVHLPKKSAEMNDHSFYLWKFSPSDENEWMQKTNPAFCIHRKISGWHDWKYFSHFFALVQKGVNLQFKCPFTFYQDFQNQNKGALALWSTSWPSRPLSVPYQGVLGSRPIQQVCEKSWGCRFRCSTGLHFPESSGWRMLRSTAVTSTAHKHCR